MFQILIYHREKLFHRRRFVRVAELVADRLGQRAFLRVQCIPQTPVCQENPNQNRTRSQKGTQVVENPHLVIQPLYLFRERLPQIEKPQRQRTAPTKSSRRNQTDQPSAGSLKTIAVFRAIRLLLFVPPDQQENHRNGKDAKNHHQNDVNNHIPGPFEIKMFFRSFL